MRPGRPVWLVAGREISERLHGRLIYVMTAFTTAIVVAAIVIPPLVKGTGRIRVALVGAGATALGPALVSGGPEAGLSVRITNLPAGSDVTQALDAKTLDVAVVDPDTTGGVTVEVSHQLDPAMQALLASAVQRQLLLSVLAQNGVSPQVVARALAPGALSVHVLHPARPDQKDRATAAIFAAVFLYFTLITYGTGVATGVAQEKTSRTAEVLLGAVPPGDLLAGKVLGIGLCGLGQIGVTVAAGLIANAAVHPAHISSVIWGLLPGILLWYLLGYGLYSFAFAAAGSLVARQEDVQMVMGPFSAVLVGGYMLTFATIANPDAPWVKLASFFPPLAPILMPARLALGHVALWETALAMALTVATALGVARLGARIYSTALVRSGPRVSWRTALRMGSEART